MAEHTPGPWSIPTPRMGFSAIHGPRGELIFGLAAGSADEKQPDDVCAANAALIEAAPDLLAALTDLIEEIETDGGVDTSCWAILDDAKAAIAKARGEQ